MHCPKSGTPTRTPPGNPHLHGRAGRGARGGAAVALVSGPDLSTGKTGTPDAAERRLLRGVARIQGCDEPQETPPVPAWVFVAASTRPPRSRSGSIAEL